MPVSMPNGANFLTEENYWETGVYQIETTDDVLGGSNGIVNLPFKCLANRTLYLKQALLDLSSSLNSQKTPTGTIITTASQSAPSGYLMCNGAALSRTAYSTLFGAIGTTFGAGDGSTTFALPDLRGLFIRGHDNGRGIDLNRVFGSQQLGTPMVFDLDFNGVHSVSASACNTFDEAAQKTQGDLMNISEYPNLDATGGSVTTRGIGLPTFAGACVSRPRNMALLFCIKY